MTKAKCKIKDLVHDLTKVYNIRGIAIDSKGVGLAVADALEDCGIVVTKWVRANKFIEARQL